jgi:hypothetical protein
MWASSEGDVVRARWMVDVAAGLLRVVMKMRYFFGRF